jgi:hypothetical protein
LVSQKLRRSERIAYLIGTQLEVVSLIWDQVTKFHREHASLVGNDQREIPVLKVNVVRTLEVVVDGDLLLGVGLTIPILEDSVLGMGTIIGIFRTTLPSEALDGVSLDICKSLLAIICIAHERF